MTMIMMIMMMMIMMMMIQMMMMITIIMMMMMMRVMTMRVMTMMMIIIMMMKMMKMMMMDIFVVPMIALILTIMTEDCYNDNIYDYNLNYHKHIELLWYQWKQGDIYLCLYITLSYTSAMMCAYLYLYKYVDHNDDSTY
jgi:hypothetical protein